jgi:hypothetical protein
MGTMKQAGRKETASDGEQSVRRVHLSVALSLFGPMMVTLGSIRGGRGGRRSVCGIERALADGYGVQDRDSRTGNWINGSDPWMVHAWDLPGMENDRGLLQTANRRICERICGAEN